MLILIFLDVAWFRGTSLLEDTGDRISFLRRRNFFSFSIFDPRPNDGGTYSCMAVNPVGEKWKQFKLEVKGKPSHGCYCCCCQCCCCFCGFRSWGSNYFRPRARFQSKSLNQSWNFAPDVSRRPYVALSWLNHGRGTTFVRGHYYTFIWIPRATFGSKRQFQS